MVELLVGLVAGLAAAGAPAVIFIRLQTQELDRVRAANERLLNRVESRSLEQYKAAERADDYFQLPQDEERYLYDDTGLVQSVEPMTDNG